MSESLRGELRSLWPLALKCLGWPLPVLLLWHSKGAGWLALCLFFVGCCSFVAYGLCPAREGGRRRFVALTVVLYAAAKLFSLAYLALQDSHDYVAVAFALVNPLPALCVTSYLMRLTRKPFASIVFTIALVACMKFLGGLVVVLVYGWDACERGYTTFRWTDPNLHTWMFWLNCAALMGVCYWLLRRRVSPAGFQSRLVRSGDLR